MKLATPLAAAFGLAACASVPAAPDQLILGKWSCSANTPDGRISGPMTYLDDGTTAFTLTMESTEGGASVIVVADGSSTWKLPGDGTIEEQIASLKIRSAKMNGMDIPPAMLGDVEDEMLDQEQSSSTIELSNRDMVLVDKEGTRTVCKR